MTVWFNDTEILERVGKVWIDIFNIFVAISFMLVKYVRLGALNATIMIYQSHLPKKIKLRRNMYLAQKA